MFVCQAELVSISNIPHSSLSLLGVIPEHLQVWPQNKQKSPLAGLERGQRESSIPGTVHDPTMVPWNLPRVIPDHRAFFGGSNLTPLPKIKSTVEGPER